MTDTPAEYENITITYGRMIELADKIKPVYHKDGQLYFMQPVDLETNAFTWAPEEAAPATDLEMLQDIPTFHTFGFSGYFKPSLNEVYDALNKLPEEVLSKVTAFSTDMFADNINDLLTQDRKRQKGITTLYTGTIPEVVKNQPIIFQKQPIKLVSEM